MSNRARRRDAIALDSLRRLIVARATKTPKAPAILARGRTPLGYDALERQVRATVSELRALGIGRTDRVAICLPDGPELAVCVVSVAAGSVAAPLNPDLRAAELDSYLGQLRCRAIVVPEGSLAPAIDVARDRGIQILELTPLADLEAGRFTLAASLDRPSAGAAPAPDEFGEPDDVALVLPTSGTSARPRLVPLTHRNIQVAAESIRAAVGLTERDRCLNVMPLFHIHGLSTIFASLAAGASVGCDERFDSDRFFAAVDELRPTWYTAAPAIHRAIVDAAPGHAETLGRSSLRFIRSASAPMPRPLIAELERWFRAPFVEAYGMTEAGPQIASNRLPPIERRAGSVGPAAGPEVAIMGDDGALVPVGVPGEVVVRGPNVMSGYDDDPDADRDAFVRGWFRTGDRGRLDADGHLFITGRLKEMINRGGEKIAPQEVDGVLMDHPAVAEAMVFAMPHPTLGEDLAAAIVLEPGAATATNGNGNGPGHSPDDLIQGIRRFVSARLSDFKVPQRIVIVAKIPTGPTGKARRRDLADLLGLTTASGRPDEITAPRNAIESRLAEIWARVLRTDRLGVHANFFQAGGDSLSAAQVVSRIARELGADLPPRTLFDRPTIAALALLLAERPHAEPAIPRRPISAPAPLSFAQQRLWLVDQIEPGNPAYHMHTALRLAGRLDADALERSVEAIVHRHDALRTTFRATADQPIQIVSPPGRIRLTRVDLTRLVGAERERELGRLGSEEAVRPFQLRHGPLVRATLFAVDSEDHVLLVTMHHVVSDGWSTGVWLRELEALYAAFSTGAPSPLQDLPIQYSDFAEWQRGVLQGEALDRELGYWRGRLAGAPPLLELPSDRRRPPVSTHQGARYSLPISAELTARIRSLSARENATPFMTMLAAFETLLHRYSGQSDIVVGTPIANRNRAELEGLIGFFANTLVMRTDLSGNPTFREALARVRETATDAYAHQDLPFERLVEELAPVRDRRHNPLFQVMFAFQNLEPAPLGTWSNLTVEPFDIARPTAKFDLTVYLHESPRGFEATWQYSTDLFDDHRIARMAGSFATLLHAIVADPETRLSALPLTSADERHETVVAWNRTDVSYPGDRCFHQRFEERARATPEAVAVQCGDAEVTYRELDRRANRLAARLRTSGVRPGARVAVQLGRSVDMVVSVLAVMKAGATYVPVDPSYPPDHVAFVLGDADVSAVVTSEDLIERLREAIGARRVLLVEPESAASDSVSELEPVAVGPADLAYVIYTSGSTGKPKGVMITHGNLSHYVDAMVDALRVGADDCYLHTASFVFSSSVRQLAVPLAAGARVVVAPAETIRDPEAVFVLVKRARVTIVDLVPSYWRVANRALAALGPETRADLLTNDLRLILSASEPLVAGVPREWDALARHGAQLINMYGQTETTGIVTLAPISLPDGDADSFVAIGRPIANTRAYVLDPAGQPVPVGVWGELYVGGAGVGLGYLNDPELTAERFVADPFSREPGARLYRTGDVARHRPNGDLELHGRLDHQLKLRGYRIEPALIEGVIDQHPDWRECAVLVHEDAAGERKLVAYVTPTPGAEGSTRELRDHLRRKLPDYMVPSLFVSVAALPRRSSGKLDRAACRALANEPVPLSPERDRSAAKLNGNRALAGQSPSVARKEAMLVELWLQVLGVDRVGLDDNFFDLGGNSILALALISRAGLAGLRITPAELWQNQTIAELARVAATGPVRESPARKPISRAVSATDDDEAPRVRVTIDSLRAFGTEALERAGLVPEGAAIVTDVQLEASLRDQPTHNMVSIPRYARRVAAGTINPRPRIRIEHQTPTSARIDGDNGPGQWVAVIAMETAIQMAREAGVGVVGVRRSNHLGAAGHYPWLAAQEGLVGLCTTNGPVILAPTGGITPTFGNNPLGIGIPAGRHHPILLDIAMSVAPRGRIGLHLAEGKPLPPGWILDRAGNPSTDPADLVAGLGVPIGGHKGYGLTLVMEVLAGVMTGASFGWGNRRDHSAKMTKPANFGHFFMAIDPELFGSSQDFVARVDQLIEQTKAGERAPNVDEILIPGEPELRARERSLRDGVPLRPSTYEALLKYARTARLETKLDVVSFQDPPRGKISSSESA